MFVRKLISLDWSINWKEVISRFTVLITVKSDVTLTERGNIRIFII